jgi:hypothetical protein
MEAVNPKDALTSFKTYLSKRNNNNNNNNNNKLDCCFHFGKLLIRLCKEQQDVRPDLLFGNIKFQDIM